MAGKDKIFFARCYECGSDIEYQLSDVQRHKCDSFVYPERFILCPECNNEISATLVTKDEYAKMMYNAAHMGFGCACSCEEIKQDGEENA